MTALCQKRTSQGGERSKAKADVCGYKRRQLTTSNRGN